MTELYFSPPEAAEFTVNRHQMSGLEHIYHHPENRTEPNGITEISEIGEIKPIFFIKQDFSQKEKPNDKHSGKMENDPVNIPKIFVDYNGTMSTKLHWDEEKMERIASVADLRTSIVIRSGKVVPQTNVTNLGDVLAWKGIANPADWFNRISVYEREETIIKLDLNKCRADIIINDQILSARVREQNHGVFSEQKFVHELNKSVNDSLKLVAIKEKLFQAGLVTAFDGLVIVGEAIPVSLTYAGIRLVTSNVRYLLNNDASFILTFTGLFLSSTSAIWAAANCVIQYNMLENLISLHHPLIKSWGDLNPFRHLKNSAAISGYFALAGRRVVEANYDLHRKSRN
jgi:hypothetical protein